MDLQRNLQIHVSPRDTAHFVKKCTFVRHMLQNMGCIDQIKTRIRKIDLVAVIIGESYAGLVARGLFQAVISNLDTDKLFSNRNCSDVSKDVSGSRTNLDDPLDFGCFATKQFLYVFCLVNGTSAAPFNHLFVVWFRIQFHQRRNFELWQLQRPAPIENKPVVV